MKKLKFIVLTLFLSSILLSFSSCLVSRRHDNGKHYGKFQKHDNHRYHSDRTVFVIGKDHHKQPAMKSYKSSKRKKLKKNH